MKARSANSKNLATESLEVDTKYRCSNVTGAEIENTWRCDGINDCRDWSDEMNCECNGDNLYKCKGSNLRNFKSYYLNYPKVE